MPNPKDTTKLYKSRLTEQSRLCKTCKGHTGAFADNYFVKKCLCHELREMEGDDYTYE